MITQTPTNESISFSAPPSRASGVAPSPDGAFRGHPGNGSLPGPVSDLAPNALQQVRGLEDGAHIAEVLDSTRISLEFLTSGPEPSLASAFRFRISLEFRPS